MATLEQLRTISQRISQHLSDVIVPNEGRHRISAALLNVADGHFQAIIILFERRLYGSAFALLRPLIETSLRAAWALHCNDDQTVEATIEKDKLPMLQAALAHLEKCEDFRYGLLSGVLAKCKKALHSYTHGGSFQVANHLRPDAIDASFSEPVIEEAMSLAAFFGLFAATHVALVASDLELAERIGREFNALESAL